MNPAALVIGLVACAAIIVLGIRFVLQPRQATLDFGIPADSLRGLTEIKGVRDITSGVVPPASCSRSLDRETGKRF